MMEKIAVVKKCKEKDRRNADDVWCVYSHDESRLLGRYKTKSEANKRLQQVEYFKQKGRIEPVHNELGDLFYALDSLATILETIDLDETTVQRYPSQIDAATWHLLEAGRILYGIMPENVS